MTHQIVPLDSAYVIHGNRKLLNFCSRDYLGISHHPDLKKRAMKMVLEHGVGEAENCFPRGKLGAQLQLEEKIALLLGKNRAALFSSRFEMHLRLLGALNELGKWTILLDERVDDLLADAVQKSGADFQFLSENHQEIPGKKLIVTESILWKEGTHAQLEETEVDWYVDASHEICLLKPIPHATVVTRSSITGAYAAFDEELEGVALNPAFLGIIDASLDLIPQFEGEIGQIEQRAFRFRKYLEELGLKTLSSSHLVPIVFSSETEAEEMAQFLYENGILTLLQENRVHFLINIQHTPDQLQQVADILRAPAMQSFTEAP